MRTIIEIIDGFVMLLMAAAIISALVCTAILTVMLPALLVWGALEAWRV